MVVGRFASSHTQARGDVAGRNARKIGIHIDIRSTGSIDETVCRRRSAHATAYRVIAAAIKNRHRTGAVFVSYALPAIGNLLERLIPANALELIAAALSHAAHGILQTLRTINPTHLSEAFRANTIVMRLGKIARCGANHLAVANVNVQKAPAVAVASAGTCKDFILRYIHGCGFFHTHLLRRTTRKRSRCSEKRCAFDEVPSGESARCGFAHFLSLPPSVPPAHAGGVYPSFGGASERGGVSPSASPVRKWFTSISAAIIV